MLHTNSLYAVYDRKAQYYLPPFTARTDTDANRAFTELVMTSETPVSQYPADFDLVRIGTIDIVTGVLTPELPVYPVINGLVCLQDAQRTRARYSSLMQPDADPVSSADIIDLSEAS